MIDKERREQRRQEKEEVRQRMRARTDPEKYEYYPEKTLPTYFDNDVEQRVAVYVRVSTDDVRQTTSYELQKRYYEEFVEKHPRWTLVDIYADEGVSGTSLKHRDAFNKMIADCKEGKIDLIVTKSISRFARNVLITVGITQELAKLKRPVGVFFESEQVYSLDEKTEMPLTFMATMAQEESHIRSRSMETSLRMRLDNGLPLTPELIGYSHDAKGNLVINQAEAPTVKLIYYMYLYGYSTKQIAEKLTELERRTYLGNVKWSSFTVIQVLRNERHCGDVLTRKTYTPDYKDHKSMKNYGQRPQSHYIDHHEGIVSRDDFIAVQRLLDNAKYKNKSILPTLQVVEDGILKGFVTVNTRWSGFSSSDYITAARSVQPEPSAEVPKDRNVPIQSPYGTLEIVRPELFDSTNRYSLTLGDNRMNLSASVIRKLGKRKYIELLIDPLTQRLAVRPAKAGKKTILECMKAVNGVMTPRPMYLTAVASTLFELMGWDLHNKYRIIGSCYEQDADVVFLFDGADAVALLKSYLFPQVQLKQETGKTMVPIAQSGKRVQALKKEWANSFGPSVRWNELSPSALEKQTEQDWKLHLEGRMIEPANRLHITPYEELKSYINKEIGIGLSVIGGTHESV